MLAVKMTWQLQLDSLLQEVCISHLAYYELKLMGLPVSDYTLPDCLIEC